MSRDVLVCPLARPLEPALATGAAKRPCSQCHRQVWFLSSGLKFDTILCIPCAQAAGVMMHDPEPLTERQRLEIARETGLHNDQLDHLWEQAIRHFKRGRR